MTEARTGILVATLVIGLGYPLAVVALLAHADVWNSTHALAFTAGLWLVVWSRVFADEVRNGNEVSEP